LFIINILMYICGKQKNMNRIFIRILQVVVNVAWWLSIPLFSVSTVGIGYKIFSGGSVQWDIPAHVKQLSRLPVLEPVSPADHFTGVSDAIAMLKINVGLTPPVIVVVILAYGFAMVVLFGILYQLRKIMHSLNTQAPFVQENTKRLRIIGWLAMCSSLLSVGNSAANAQILNHHFKNAGEIYTAQINLGLVPLAIGAVVLILAEIFRQGYLLKTDNESII
jgi:hypothetical protein